VLNEVAEKRLSAIREFAEFNSGFKIAMRDLEIRGAGNILGAEQSGHLMSVGYDMYLKLLEEAVHEEKGEKVPEKPECSADLAISANIPSSYVESAEQRMDLYRRIAHIRTEEDADDMTDELIDRFGDPPSSVNALIHIALLRGEAADTGISEISQKDGKLIFSLSDFEMDRISKLYTMPEYKSRLKIEAGTKPAMSLKLKSGERVLDTAVKLVRDYKAT
jgi:transcription-repair coupling factor (superfamily II helicase)